MITEEMVYMALKYQSAQRPLGYTYYRNSRELIAIYDKNGNKIDSKDHIKVRHKVIEEMQRIHRERIKYEESIKNI